jgi:hypothetical protein
MHVTVPRRLAELSRYGGLVAVALEWIAVAFFHLRTNQGLHGGRPISYFSTLPETRLVFSLCFALAATSFWIFVIGHLRNHFDTPTTFFTFAALGLLGVALVPYHPESHASNLVHVSIAYVMTLGFLFGIYSLAKSNNDKLLRKNSAVLVILGAVIATAMGFLPRNLAWVVLQIVLGLIIQLWIIWITFYTPGPQLVSKSSEKA